MGQLRTKTHERAVDLASTNSQYSEVTYGPNWFLLAVGVSIFCIGLVALNIQAWNRLEAVCDVAMSKDALTLCPGVSEKPAAF